MGVGCFRLYVCLLVILTCLNLSARVMPERRTQHAASGARAEQEQAPSAARSPQMTNSQQEPQGSAASNRTPMTSAELTDQLNHPEAAVKNHILVFQRRSISGDPQLGVERLPVAFRVEFHDCEFQGRVSIGMNYVIGFGHKWLFSYGRAWYIP
jgi:hypothetical protein